eukprot:s3303_g3.t1
MRINVETLPFLMTEDKDIPLLRMAMAYTAHEEALLRTQARSAMLTLFGKMKMGEGQLSQTESTASLSADQPSSLEEYPSFTACGLAVATKVAATVAPDMASSDWQFAEEPFVMQALLVRLVLLPSIPSSSIRAMADLDAGCVSEAGLERFDHMHGRWIPDLQPSQYQWQDLLSLTEHFVTGAMEDCTFIARDHEDGKPPTRREVLARDAAESTFGASNDAQSFPGGIYGEDGLCQ